MIFAEIPERLPRLGLHVELRAITQICQADMLAHLGFLRFWRSEAKGHFPAVAFAEPGAAPLMQIKKSRAFHAIGGAADPPDRKTESS